MAPKISLRMEQMPMVYRAGQNINGSVIVEAEKKIQCKCLSIAFAGFASVAWTQRKVRRRTYCAQESFYDSRQQLWADLSQEIPSGVSEFAFTFALPLDTPASFDGKHGQLVHQMTITLETAKGKEITKIQPFTVYDVADLNLDPSSREPQMQQTTHSPSWSRKGGPVSVAVRLDKSGYTPGEPILINAEIKNETKTTISETNAKLIMNATYKANGMSKYERRTLMIIRGRPIAEGEEDMWENKAMMIPVLSTSHLPGCNIIDVSYLFQFSVRFKGVSPDLKMKFHINLGTIPVADASTEPQDTKSSAVLSM